MKQRVLLNSLIDLTPLLDVVFILLFAFLMTMSMEKDASDEKANQLAETLAESAGEMEALVEENNQLRTNLERIKEQQANLNEGFVKWFAQEGTVDVFQNNALMMSVFDLEKTSQSLYQMEFITNQYVMINVSVDAKNQNRIVVNGTTTTYQLNAALSRDESGQAAVKKALFALLEDILSNKEGGYQNVLLTLTDDGYMYKYAYELIWNVFGQLENKSANIHKLYYITY
jgi:hypothetical protein